MKKTDNYIDLDQIEIDEEELPLELNQAKKLINYYYFKKVFSKSDCEKIINVQDSEKRAKIYTGLTTDITQRNTISKLLYPEEKHSWIYRRLAYIAKTVNKDYGFNLEELEFPQILKYKKKGFYTWHMDLGKDTISRRKLSMITFLSDNNDYEGGSLNFFPKQKKISQEQGSVILFPAYLFHKVNPVKKGVRYSMVTWIRGNKKFT